MNTFYIGQTVYYTGDWFARHPLPDGIEVPFGTKATVTDIPGPYYSPYLYVAWDPEFKASNERRWPRDGGYLPKDFSSAPVFEMEAFKEYDEIIAAQEIYDNLSL